MMFKMYWSISLHNKLFAARYALIDSITPLPSEFMILQPTGPIETTLCDFESVESVNKVLHTSLAELVKAPFFKYFRTDLYRECPFWQENGFCMNRECGITTVDEVWTFVYVT